ncbi:hypothetical protein [Streptomyces sp. NPDC049881]|uniref:hypothetical protein n=1 Tax=unclassified Streptomyces TaxID=2593676 RepID=UPI00343FE979
MTAPTPLPYTEALLRHFTDLRDGTHGHDPAPHEHTRLGKERLFRTTVTLLDPHARAVLAEIDTALLAGTGTVTVTAPHRTPDGGLDATWDLSWPEQRAARVAPVRLHAFYGRTFHHPHLQGGTVGQWPLNVFTAQQAEAELPTLRAIASADLHNLVYQRDHRLIPAAVSRT